MEGKDKYPEKKPAFEKIPLNHAIPAYIDGNPEFKQKVKQYVTIVGHLQPADNGEDLALQVYNIRRNHLRSFYEKHLKSGRHPSKEHARAYVASPVGQMEFEQTFKDKQKKDGFEGFEGYEERFDTFLPLLAAPLLKAGAGLVGGALKGKGGGGSAPATSPAQANVEKTVAAAGKDKARLEDAKAAHERQLLAAKQSKELADLKHQLVAKGLTQQQVDHLLVKNNATLLKQTKDAMEKEHIKTLSDIKTLMDKQRSDSEAKSGFDLSKMMLPLVAVLIVVGIIMFKK